jgi:SAM-dependent methyltransferase
VTRPCPRCGGAASFALRTFDRNRVVSQERFEYWRCGACSLLWLPAVPADLGAYYPADYHESIAPPQIDAAIAAEQPHVDLVTAHVQPGQMVEIGPSQGIFAQAAQRAGFDVVGMEMDADCCRRLERVGVRAINTMTPEDELPALAPSRAVAMWHVIEHLPDPWIVLRAIAANLAPGGVLVLATPNPDSFQFRLLGARWVHLDAPRHLSLIPLAALRDEAAGLGLELMSATTSDKAGVLANRLGWERALMPPPVLRRDPRFAYLAGRVLRGQFAAWEARGMRGSAYTAVFKKL